MVTEGAMVDIVGQGFDAGVRLEELVPPDMIAVRSTVRYARSWWFARLLRGRKLPRTPAELAEHRCIRRRTGRGTIYRLGV